MNKQTETCVIKTYSLIYLLLFVLMLKLYRHYFNSSVLTIYKLPESVPRNDRRYIVSAVPIKVLMLNNIGD